MDDLNVVTQILGDEDCLFLDVYRPNGASGDISQRLPVLVFIHGGSFSVGSSTSDFHGVDLLIDHVSLKPIMKSFLYFKASYIL